MEVMSQCLFKRQYREVSIFILFFKYNQEDATLYNMLYYMFQAVSPPIIRSSKTASGSSMQGRYLPDAVCTVFELLMVGEGTA
jgi:hypothetical protein